MANEVGISVSGTTLQLNSGGTNILPPAPGPLATRYGNFVSAAGVGNGADTTQDPLWTLTSLPANTLISNGQSLILTLAGQTGATGNNKAFGVTVGGTNVPTGIVTGNNVAWVGTVMITRVDSTHVNVTIQVAAGTATASGSSYNLVVSDLTANTLAVVVTGASPTTGAANDVKLMSGLAELNL